MPVPAPATGSMPRPSPATARMPIADLRARFKEVAGDLRGYLTVVPESRWIKHAAHQEFFFGEMTEHYEEHQKDLAAILGAVS